MVIGWCWQISSIGWRYYGVLGAARTEIPERHDPARALPIIKESNGYCPICGHWSICTNMIINAKTHEEVDTCLFCDAIFDPSRLVFKDTETCKCGHPKDYHEKNALFCAKGKELANCQCEKYKPTEVTIKEGSSEEKKMP